jgi:DNA-binding GntR family transcriptional regulator
MKLDPESPAEPLALRPDSLASTLVRELENCILSGELAPGERINEVQLAMRFGTSRGPVREATRSLEAKGLVEAVRNRGVYIRNVPLEEALEIYDLRSALLALAARLLALRVNDRIAANLRDRLDKMEKAAEVRDFKIYYPLNLAFHAYIMEMCGNETVAATYQSQVNKLHLFRARSLVQGGGIVVSNREHREIAEAVMAGDPERAHAAGWRHVARAKQRLLASLSKN